MGAAPRRIHHATRKQEKGCCALGIFTSDATRESANVADTGANSSNLDTPVLRTTPAMANTSATPATPAIPDAPDAPLRLPPVLQPQPASGAQVTPTPFRWRIPWRRICLNALAVWAITRVVFLAFTYFAAGLPQTAPHPFPGLVQPTPNPNVNFLSVWYRFDTSWYISIAREGYARPEQLAFFPLYPALIRLFSYPVGGNFLLAALIVSNLATFAALVALGALVAWEERDDGASTRAMILMLAFPFAFFLAAAYTESLFIAIAAFCLLFARQGRWGLATLFAALAGATRPTGVVLILPLAWEWARQNGLLDASLWRGLLRRDRSALRQLYQRAVVAWNKRRLGLASLFVIPAFFALFMVFAGLNFGHPMLVFNVHRDYWGLKSAPVWTTIYRELHSIAMVPYASSTQVIMVLDCAVIAAVAVAVIALWRSLPGAYNLYMLGLLYLSVAQPTAVGAQVLQSPGRFLLPALPIYLGLSVRLERRPAWVGALVIIGSVLQGYIALRFLTGVLVE